MLEYIEQIGAISIMRICEAKPCSNIASDDSHFCNHCQNDKIKVTLKLTRREHEILIRTLEQTTDILIDKD